MAVKPLLHLKFVRQASTETHHCQRTSATTVQLDNQVHKEQQNVKHGMSFCFLLLTLLSLFSHSISLTLLFVNKTIHIAHNTHVLIFSSPPSAFFPSSSPTTPPTKTVTRESSTPSPGLHAQNAHQDSFKSKTSSEASRAKSVQKDTTVP